MIQELIENPFSEERFKQYIKELNIQINNTMKDYESLDEDISFKKIAVDELKDRNKIEVFILKRDKDIKNAKVIFNEYLKKMMEVDTNIGLMATYYEKNPSIWKLSLVVQEQGTQLTIPKRYTFELGKDIPNKTTLEQLNKLNKNSTLEDIKEIFSVEKLSNDFFKEYKNLYNEIVKDVLVVKKENRKQIQKDSIKAIKDERKIKAYIKK